MIKLNVHTSNMLKILVVVCLSTLPGLSFSDEMSESYTSENSRQPKTEQGGLTLIGTWILSNSHNAPKTDNLIIQNISQGADGNISAVGKYEPEGTDSELNIICLDNNDLSYKCFANDASGGIVAFFFTINGNVISSGFFGIGQSIEIAENVALSELFPISGYRLSSGAKVDANGELTIPAVEYEGQFYRVVLKDEGGFKFGIKEVSAVK